MDDVAPESTETQELLAQAQAGMGVAVDRLMACHREYLHRFVEFRLDPKMAARVDPSDVVQDAQLEATRRLNEFLQQRPMPFRLWLRQIAYDRLVMLRRYHIRAARRTVDREVALSDRSSLLLAGQLLAGSTASKHFARRELAAEIRKAMAQVPAHDREVLVMRTFEGLSFAEVAWLLDIDPAAARKRHGRALLRLHKLLADAGLTELPP
jgi:RNA polymerase sigma-70 factor (ECF subfamily)